MGQIEGFVVIQVGDDGVNQRWREIKLFSQKINCLDVRDEKERV